MLGERAGAARMVVHPRARTRLVQGRRRHSRVLGEVQGSLGVAARERSAMKLLPTASRTALWMICAWHARDDVPVDPERPNPYTAWGLANHDALEALRHDAEPDLKAIADARGLSPAQCLALPKSIAALKAIDAPKHALSEV